LRWPGGVRPGVAATGDGDLPAGARSLAFYSRVRYT
jgi:hypothetical protein